MASKVVVGLAQHGPFQQQGKNKRDDVVNLGYLGSTATNPELRVKHLEQNVRYLQEQHQIMLSGLHREVEVLRRRNRDLQFQLVFSKGGVAVLQSTPNSSPEDDCPRTVVISPGQVNITPLQVELLERDLAELKTNLSEARTRNVYLLGVVDEQKKVIQAMEDANSEIAAVGKKMSVKSSQKTPQADEEDTSESLQDKLDDADRLVRRLRRENEEQRKEIVSLRTAVGKSMAENRRGEGGNRHYPRNSHNQHSQTSRFPPLYPHNHWNAPKNNGDFYKTDRGGNHMGREGEHSHGSTLPLLRERNGPASSGFSNYSHNPQPGPNHRRGYPHHRGGSRTYRNNYRENQQEQD